MVAPVKITWDEKSVADGGRVVIRAYNPFAEDGTWTAKASNGYEYTGAQITSEGFQIFGLPPYRYYSAGIVSYLSHQETLQDSWDIWDNHMPVTNVANGHRLGFKHFGFGGLAEAQRGLPPFEGTAVGNNTHFNVWLTPVTPRPFRVNVWLDGPWDTEAWGGTLIGVIDVPANSPRETTRFTIDVSRYVDHLEQKNAIFLVAEALPGPQRPGQGGGQGAGQIQQGPLFDMIGLGFSADGREIERPIAPTVSIAVNDVAVALPPHPVRSTYENGIIGYDLYETTVPLWAGTTRIPTVAASASKPEVTMSITQADAPFGTAVVKFDYKGVVKTYRVVFVVGE
jgi:hypothetical protein